MRTRLLYTFAFILALAVLGYAAASGLTGHSGSGDQPASASAATATAQPQAAATNPTATPQPATGSEATATPSASATSVTAGSNTSAVNAIKAVINQANEEQQQAFARQDPTIMKDTATSSYYNELAQINADMANGGVTAIKLLQTEWGPVTLTNATTAQATTYETWQTNYADGSTDQSRDRNVYTLVQEQGVWKIQSDDHPDSNPSQPTGQSVGTPPTTPSSPSSPVSPTAPAAAGSTDLSRNWAGYAATGGTYTAVSGTWKVPQPASTASTGASATWVGIGGVNSNDLIQAGTQEVSNGSGSVHYSAWIEMLPQVSRTVKLTVSPGDSVTVSITQQQAGQWLISLKNNTTGQSYQTTVQYRSSLSSAEWINEAPSSGRRIVPLNDFGTVQFTAGSAVKDGKTVTIAGAGAQPIAMMDAQGNTVATPSALTGDGAGFSVSQTAASTNVTPAQPQQRRRTPSLPSAGTAMPTPWFNSAMQTALDPAIYQ